ncbi:MAG: hypothetical protein QM734_08605 [Cyclobacteriaceae bacterium]
MRWLFFGKGLSEEESAKIIGNHFPSISDKLLNLVQLSSKSSNNDLTKASILQKSGLLENVSFEKAVDIKSNRKYLRYLLVPLALILILTFVNSNIFTKSTNRIVKFNQEFSPEAPFHFKISNKNLQAFFNEDFILNLEVDGSSLPESAFLVVGTQKLKLEKINSSRFQYVFEKLQHPVHFQIEASGFFSSPNEINIVNRPELSEIKIKFDFPVYTGKRSETLTNAGNIEIPEGTKVSWNIRTEHADKAHMSFSEAPKENEMQIIDNQLFVLSRVFKNNDQYSITLKNNSGNSDGRISYSIDVVKDQFPQIIVENFRDSILYKSILLGGQIKDDYGLTELRLIYQINESTEKHFIKMPIAKSVQQSFYHLWKLDSLQLSPGDKLNYYFEVWDNDGVNGRKSTRSADYVFALPSKEELKTIVSDQQQLTESKIDQGVEKAKELKKSIDEAQQKLRSKTSLDWQEKKLLEDLIDQKKKLDSDIKELQKQNQLLEQQKETFTQENEKIKEKSEQIQKLMDELLDDETKKMFEELEKLLKENIDPQQIQRLLEKMDRKEINLEQELERALELFKQLQYEYKLDQAINEIGKQAEKQEKLLNETQQSADDKNKSDSNEKSSEELSKEQEQLQKDLKEFEKSVEDMKKLGDEIQEEDKGPSKEELQELENSEQNSKESLDQKQPKKSMEHQKKALSKMQEIQKGLKQMQSSMQMEMDTQNLESLRQIVHGLIKLSYDQENLMKEFNSIQQSDPKYVQVSQGQISLQNDSKVLEDSLLALSKKDPFLSSIVTREISELNEHVDKVVSHIKERRKGNASSEMQFSMTNINNLALMLNNHFEMMMNAMANGKGKPGKSSGKGGKSAPNLGKMQQEINGQIQKLKSGQKVGRQFSEDLAKLAAEQERIRRALKEMQDKMKKEGGKEIGGDLPSKMEQTEMDLVNKQITEQTIRRQNEILTRLLEAEKSMREQDLDKERKGETAKDHQKDVPQEFEQYLRLKEKEVELLKSLPPMLFPYYKNEVTEYFKRIK